MPLEHLERVSDDPFAPLARPAFLLHSVCVEKSDLFCGGGTKCVFPFHLDLSPDVRSSSCVDRAYSGYIDIAAGHPSFTFVERFNDPTDDTVVIWISKGRFAAFQTLPGVIARVRILL